MLSDISILISGKAQPSACSQPSILEYCDGDLARASKGGSSRVTMPSVRLNVLSPPASPTSKRFTTVVASVSWQKTEKGGVWCTGSSLYLQQQCLPLIHKQRRKKQRNTEVRSTYVVVQ